MTSILTKRNFAIGAIAAASALGAGVVGLCASGAVSITNDNDVKGVTLNLSGNRRYNLSVFDWADSRDMGTETGISFQTPSSYSALRRDCAINVAPARPGKPSCSSHLVLFDP
ncbi:MAG: hypothetical protein WDO70_02465 [Alphaproteobacteria bacterium]